MLGLILNGFLSILAILGILYILSGYKETFLSPGMYPISEDRGLLDSWKMQSHPGLSNFSYGNSYKLYPMTPEGSYAQVTNNKRYWSSPCNATSSPADMCGGMYVPRDPSIPAQPCRPNLDCNQGSRVNFYCSNLV